MVVETALYNRLSIPYDATTDDVKRSYRKAALKWHPDRNKDNPGAGEKFKQCSQAYEILSDPQKRAIYDEAGLQGVLGGGSTNRHSVYTRNTYNQAMSNADADDPGVSSQPQRKAASSSFRFQASWSFGFGSSVGSGESNRATYWFSSSSNGS